VLGELAPTGKLRAAFILTNPVQVVKDPATGELRGPAIDLGRALASELGVPFEPVGQPRGENIVAGATSGAWDIAFLAIDPARAEVLDFSPPYLAAHNTYLIPAGSPLRGMDEVDRPGVRIGVNQADTADLYLSRTLKNAQLMRNPGGLPMTPGIVKSGQVDLYAGNRVAMASVAAQIPGTRLMDGNFLSVQQAIALPKGHGAGLRYVTDFIEHAKASGQVQQAIERYALRGVDVAPAAK
jgi:polar amino acid transport system substrate-binding protein